MVEMRKIALSLIAVALGFSLILMPTLLLIQFPSLYGQSTNYTPQAGSDNSSYNETKSYQTYSVLINGAIPGIANQSQEQLQSGPTGGTLLAPILVLVAGVGIAALSYLGVRRGWLGL